MNNIYGLNWILVMLVEETLVEVSDVGLNDKHLDAVADQLEAQGFGQSVDGVFRSRVHGQARLRIIPLSRQTAYVYYPS